MPPRKRKVEFMGRQVEATSMPYQSGGEHWNEYLIDDGSVVRVKLVVTEIMRIDDEYDAEGNPVYLVKSANVMAITAPDNLRKGG